MKKVFIINSSSSCSVFLKQPHICKISPELTLLDHMTNVKHMKPNWICNYRKANEYVGGHQDNVDAIASQDPAVVG